MYVIRPQFFIPMITLLRNAAMKTVKAKGELEMIREQNLDITNFEKEVNDFKAAQSRSFKENIFVKENFCDLILSPVNDSLKRLEDAVIRLKKERRLYAAQEVRLDK